MRASLTAAMRHMSGVERDAVELRVIAELDYHQIAARLNCSEAAARTRVQMEVWLNKRSAPALPQGEAMPTSGAYRR